MKSYNEIRLECMDICYLCIDRDIVGKSFRDYETSLGYAFTYDYPPLNSLDKAIWCFTLIIRFARSGMIISKNGTLEQETRIFIEKIHSLSPSEKDGLPDELFTDLSEVESYLKWVEEKRQ